mmetsp:Transcript_7039/g.17460  ORF Transcript_7039/g.17460 Transcript_7039/m.17460 type:complete len:226 (-) Transcript_7039:447-1124(-)
MGAAGRAAAGVGRAQVRGELRAAAGRAVAPPAAQHGAPPTAHRAQRRGHRRHGAGHRRDLLGRGTRHGRHPGPLRRAVLHAAVPRAHRAVVAAHLARRPAHVCARARRRRVRHARVLHRGRAVRRAAHARGAARLLHRRLVLDDWPAPWLRAHVQGAAGAGAGQHHLHLPVYGHRRSPALRGPGQHVRVAGGAGVHAVWRLPAVAQQDARPGGRRRQPVVRQVRV